jgi:hypothetical protein
MREIVTSFRKDRLLSAKDFALYYGYGKVKELSLFDMVIVDPKGLALSELEQLKQNNTVIITYFSVLEVHPWEPIFKELSIDDFVIVDGEPLLNEAFGTYLVSLQSHKWVNYLLNRMHHNFHVIESDGLFLDTIGDLELHSLPEQWRKQQIHALENILSVAKVLYPNHLFIQNNGLELVAPITAPYIDGICWENPPFTLEESQEWVKVKVDQLCKLKEQYQLRILLLFEETIEQERNAYESGKKIAKKLDFLAYRASKNYVDGFYIS